jgi:hypothetical protein
MVSPVDGGIGGGGPLAGAVGGIGGGIGGRGETPAGGDCAFSSASAAARLLRSFSIRASCSSSHLATAACFSAMHCPMN